jgi:hypothetical protein
MEAGSFWATLYPIASNWLVRGIVLLLAANFLTGVLVAIKAHDFRLGALGDWMSPLLLMIGGGTCVQLVAWAVPPEYGGIGELGAKTVWLLIIAALIGKVLSNVSALGVTVPAALTDRPKATTKAAP